MCFEKGFMVTNNGREAITHLGGEEVVNLQLNSVLTPVLQNEEIIISLLSRGETNRLAPALITIGGENFRVEDLTGTIKSVGAFTVLKLIDLITVAQQRQNQRAIETYAEMIRDIIIKNADIDVIIAMLQNLHQATVQPE